MPKPRLSSLTQADLKALSRVEFGLAWEMLVHVSRNPGEGKIVLPMQYEMDPTLHRPCTEYTRLFKAPRRATIYYEAQAGELHVYRIVSYDVL